MRFSFDDVADHYTQSRRPLPEIACEHVGSFLQQRKARVGADIVHYVDLATGNGGLVRNLPPMSGVKFSAIDLSRQMLGEARRLSSKNGIDFIEGDVHEPILPAQSVDVATCCQAIHLLDANRFLKQVNDMLTPSGIFAVVTFDLIASPGSPAKITNDIFQSLVAHELWPGFSSNGIHPHLLEQLEENGLIPFESHSYDCMFSFSALEWQKRVESSSLSLKFEPHAVRRAMLSEHKERVIRIFGNSSMNQRQRCWIVSACKPGFLEKALL